MVEWDPIDTQMRIDEEGTDGAFGAGGGALFLSKWGWAIVSNRLCFDDGSPDFCVTDDKLEWIVEDGALGLSDPFVVGVVEPTATQV